MGEDEDHERLGEKLYNSRHDIHPLTVERSQKRKHFEDSDDEFERSMDGDGEDEEDKDEEDEAEKDEEMEFLWGYPVHGTTSNLSPPFCCICLLKNDPYRPTEYQLRSK